MYYSYYYDIEKTHRINFGLKALTTNEESNGTINVQFNVYIREILNNEIKKEEIKNIQFRFDASLRNDENDSDYDLDALRERIAGTNKLIFKVVNNRDTSQNVTIGLITPTAANNPLGCEIVYEDEPYTAEIKAGNISRLEDQYVEPLIRQTVANYTFNEGGLPEEIMVSGSPEYVNGYKLYRMTDFRLSLKEVINTSNKFAVEINVAPENFDVAVEPAIFDLILHGVGTFTLNKTTINFLTDGTLPEHKATAPLVQALTPEYFFNSGLRTTSLVKVSGDGKGNLKVSYAGVEIITTYDKTQELRGISLEGKVRKDNGGRVRSKVDNIVAYYEK